MFRPPITPAIREVCQRYHIRRLALFGSRLTSDFRADSDLDILVEFEPNKVPGFAFATLQRELSLLWGYPVDLHTAKSLSRYFRQDVEQQAHVLYEASA
jgi:predicted nucleotidyltransferase